MPWLLDYIGTVIVAFLLVAAVAFIVRRIIKDKAAGKSSCGCGCANCAMRGSCHGGKEGNGR